MNFIIVVWALGVARLMYFIIGIVKPDLLKSGHGILAIIIPAVFLGAWLGAFVYNNWPERHRTGSEYASLWRVFMCSVVALPFFVLLWSSILEIASCSLIIVMVMTVAPCLYERWLEREDDEVETIESEGDDEMPPARQTTPQQHVKRQWLGWTNRSEFSS